MKQIYVFVICLLSIPVFSQDTRSQSSQTKITGNDAAQSGGGVTSNGKQSYVCCSRIFLSTPAMTQGGRATTKTLSTNPFKGKNKGIDLTFDFIDPQGAVVPGLDAAITKNPSGDVVVDGSKLPKGKKLRLRAKAGSAVESYIIN